MSLLVSFMRQKIVVGNWKMNASKIQSHSLSSELVLELNKITSNKIIIICPPTPYLAQVESLVAGSIINLGVQNINPNDLGAHTGEVSVSMALDFGVKYVIVGHSERREMYGDSNEVIIAKIQKTIAAGITPIFCIGETLEQRESKQMQRIIAAQLNAIIDTLGVEIFPKTIIAYEPIWAIGTGVTASTQQAQDVHYFIRGLLAQHNNQIAQKTSILYGGSVNSTNAAKLFACEDIDGGLVGGASLKADDFLAIINS